MKKLNITFGAIHVAVAVYLFHYASGFKAMTGQKDIGPSAFPRAICIAIVPAAGADIAAWVSYDVTKKRSKHPEKFGEQTD